MTRICTSSTCVCGKSIQLSSHIMLCRRMVHSKDVDFPKNGLLAEMARDVRPHFMEKRHLPEHKICCSKRVLGIFYD